MVGFRQKSYLSFPQIINSAIFRKKRLFLKKSVDTACLLLYNIKRSSKMAGCRNGGIAQLARARGSYPRCHWFKSNYRYHFFNIGPLVKRLRLRPFTAASRVRFSYGSPKNRKKFLPVLFINMFYLLSGGHRYC